MNYTLILIVISIFNIVTFLQSEIVRRSDGSLVELKENGSWKLAPVDDDINGKVVFTIVKVYEGEFDSRDVFRTDIDDFGNEAGYRYLPKVYFEIEIRNNTKFGVKVGGMKLLSTKFEDESLGGNSTWVNEAIQPGESVIEKLRINTYFESKKKLTKEEFNRRFSQYTIKNLRSSLYISNYPSFDPFISFDPKSKISNEAAESFVIGNPNGVLPLKKRVTFFRKTD